MRPSEKLLESMVKLEEKYSKYIGIDIIDGKKELFFDNDDDIAREIIEDMKKIHPQFEKMGGISRTTPEYKQAAEIHRLLLYPILSCRPEWSREISASFYYFI